MKLVVGLRFILIHYIATEANRQNIEPFCYLRCLQTQDYIDLLYTTVAEFPGNFFYLLFKPGIHVPFFGLIIFYRFSQFF